VTASAAENIFVHKCLKGNRREMSQQWTGEKELRNEKIQVMMIKSK
jgi:hypothetical protein